MRLEKSGRILIPAAVRRRLGLKEGESEVLLEINDHEPIVLTARAQALRRAQAVLSKYAAAGHLISEELISEREQEARRENEE